MMIKEKQELFERILGIPYEGFNEDGPPFIEKLAPNLTHKLIEAFEETEDFENISLGPVIIIPRRSVET